MSHARIKEALQVNAGEPNPVPETQATESKTEPSTRPQVTVTPSVTRMGNFPLRQYEPVKENSEKHGTLDNGGFAFYPDMI